MIDLHCHILPGIDDGAADLDEALAMARIAIDDGIRTIACTSHIYPGLFDNVGPDLARRREALAAALTEAGLDLALVAGADVQLAPDIVAGLRDGRIPSLNGTRYFLFEPPHHVAPPRLEAVAAEHLAAGWVPIVTHPERLTWIGDHYEMMGRLVRKGALMQVTAGALTGMFGRGPATWAERLLGDGLVHVLASDGHNVRRRVPVLSKGRDRAAQLVGEAEARLLVEGRPQAILDDAPPDALPPPPGVGRPAQPPARGPFDWLRRRVR